MKTAVIAIAKNENHYIREWVEYNKGIGFTNVILYDNNDVDGERFEDVIGDYIDSGFVKLRDCRGMSSFHQKSYQLCYDEFQNEYDWMAFFDIDEFIEIDEKYGGVEDFFSEEFFDDADMIRISWKYYDDNDLVRVVNNDYSLRSRFTRAVDENFVENKWTKGIIRGGLGKITVNRGVDGAHLVLIPEIKKAVNCKGEVVSNLTIRNGRCWENAWLCHYRFKTIEEYVNKRRRGWTVEGYDKKFTDSLFNLDMFFIFNKRTKEKEDLYNELISGLK